MPAAKLKVVLVHCFPLAEASTAGLGGHTVPWAHHGPVGSQYSSLLNFAFGLSFQSYKSPEQLLPDLSDQLNLINPSIPKLYEVHFSGPVEDISLWSLQFLGTQLTTSHPCFLPCILNDILVNTTPSCID